MTQTKGWKQKQKRQEKNWKKKITAAQREHLRWAYEKAKKEYETYEQRITDLSDFIYTAEKEIERQRKQESGGNA